MRNEYRLSGKVIAAVLVFGAALAGAGGYFAQRSPRLPNARRADGGVMLPSGWHLTPAGTHVPLPGDMPYRMLLADDGKTLIVNTGGYNTHSVNAIDLASKKVVSSVNVGKTWTGMCMLPSGDIYLSAGGPSKKVETNKRAGGVTDEAEEALTKPILRLGYQDGKLTWKPSVGIAGLRNKERWISGLTPARDGSLYAVNIETDTVYKIDPSTGAVKASAKTGYGAYAAALSPDGKTLAVSNWGAESVSLLDPDTLQLRALVAVGSRPNDLVYGPDGRLFVANAGSNSVSVLRGDKVVETIRTALDSRNLVGATPDALAVARDGKRLYVANADNNDVAVVDLTGEESKVLGFIPTGWYPTALAVSADGKQLYVGNGKGLEFGPNGQHKADGSPTFTYIGNMLKGSVSIVDVPDAKRLAAYSRQVVANVPRPDADAPSPAVRAAAEQAFGKIKHVVYIIRENRTYDQVFGDVKSGNGDPSLVFFGENVTPNAHKLAADYVLMDNLYCSGEVSEDGHMWCNSAFASDFLEKSWPNQYSGRGEPDKDGRLRDSPGGFLWDMCAKKGLSYRSYGEMANFKSDPDAPPVFTGTSGLNGHASAAWSATKGRDYKRVEVFIDEMRAAEKDGNWPRYMVMSLGEDHTEGAKAGAFTPAAHVASNDQALGKIVEAVSHSKFWKETAIFVIEDDAQNGPDHVDAHRTVGLVISPYVRRGVVDHTFYTTASFVRTMELILGLPPMTQYDATATPLYATFGGAPVVTAYTNLPARIDLEARNPTNAPGAKQSARMDFSEYDRCDPDALNAVLWQALKPGKPMPAPVRSAWILR